MKKRKSLKKPIIAAVTAILVIAAAVGVWGLLRSNTSLEISAGQETKGETPSTASNTGTSKDTGSNGDGGSQTAQSGNQKDSGSQSSPTNLLAPSGNFVSNHKPGVNGAPTSETSVCTSTPGATCTISFTQGASIKSLPAKTTDQGGSAYWDWDVNSLGLTQGSWQVQATATLNGHSKTSKDAMNLDIP